MSVGQLSSEGDHQKKAGESRRLPAGTILFLEGEVSDGIYFIEDGMVEIYREQAGEYVTLTIMNPGELIGTITMLTDSPRTASARAKTDARLLFYGRDACDRILEGVPKMAKALFKDVTLRLKQVNNRLVDAELKLEHLKALERDHVGHAVQLIAFLKYTLEIQQAAGTGSTQEKFMESAHRVLGLTPRELGRMVQVLGGHKLLKVSPMDAGYDTSVESETRFLGEVLNIFVRYRENPRRGVVPSELVGWVEATEAFQVEHGERSVHSYDVWKGEVEGMCGRGVLDGELAELESLGVVQVRRVEGKPVSLRMGMPSLLMRCHRAVQELLALKMEQG